MLMCIAALRYAEDHLRKTLQKQGLLCERPCPPKSFSYGSPITVRRFMLYSQYGIDPEGRFFNMFLIIFWLVLSSPDSQNPKIQQQNQSVDSLCGCSVATEIRVF